MLLILARHVLLTFRYIKIPGVLMTYIGVYLSLSLGCAMQHVVV